jgi:hypothetical protein
MNGALNLSNYRTVADFPSPYVSFLYSSAHLLPGSIAVARRMAASFRWVDHNPAGWDGFCLGRGTFVRWCKSRFDL